MDYGLLHIENDFKLKSWQDYSPEKAFIKLVPQETYIQYFSGLKIEELLGISILQNDEEVFEYNLNTLNYAVFENGLLLEFEIPQNYRESCLRLRITFNAPLSLIPINRVTNIFICNDYDTTYNETTFVTYKHSENYYNDEYSQLSNIYQRIRIPIHFITYISENEAEDYNDFSSTPSRANIGRNKINFFERWAVFTSDYYHNIIQTILSQDFVYLRLTSRFGTTKDIRYIFKAFANNGDDDNIGFIYDKELVAYANQDDVLLQLPLFTKLRPISFTPSNFSIQEQPVLNIKIKFNEFITLENYEVGKIKIKNINTGLVYDVTENDIIIVDDEITIGGYVFQNNNSYTLFISEDIIKGQLEFYEGILFDEYTFSLSFNGFLNYNFFAPQENSVISLQNDFGGALVYYINYDVPIQIGQGGILRIQYQDNQGNWLNYTNMALTGVVPNQIEISNTAIFMRIPFSPQTNQRYRWRVEGVGFVTDLSGGLLSIEKPYTEFLLIP